MPEFKVTRLGASDQTSPRTSDKSPRIELSQGVQLKTLGEEEETEYRRHGVITSARNSRKLIYLQEASRSGPGSGGSRKPSSPQAASPNDYAADSVNKIVGAFPRKEGGRNGDHLGPHQSNR